jgi:hypothetical protein
MKQHGQIEALIRLEVARDEEDEASSSLGPVDEPQITEILVELEVIVASRGPREEPQRQAGRGLSSAETKNKFARVTLSGHFSVPIG